MLPIAVVPVLFGIQQVSEGLVWMGLNAGNPDLVKKAGVFFLFFAICFWPFWVPLCAILTRTRIRERVLFGFLSFLGLGIGLVVFVPLIVQPVFPLADVVGHSIHYDIAGSAAFGYFPSWLWEIAYVVIVASPLLTASDSKMVYLGIALVLTSAITYLLFWFTFASVWCFFAAALSLYLCIYFGKLPSGDKVGVRRPN